MFKKIKSFLNEVTTRSGAEELLGIRPNNLYRELKIKALNEFKERYPEYIILYGHSQGIKSDYDGYVQYYDLNNNKVCLLEEREFRVRNAWDSHHDSEYRNKRRGYDFIEWEMLPSDTIPKIKDLLGASKKESEEIREKICFGMNIVLAQVYVEKLFLDKNKVTERKKLLRGALENMIANLVLPFVDFDDLATSSSYAQLLAISQFLFEIKVSTPEDKYEFYRIDSNIFSALKRDPFFDPIITIYLEALSSIKTAQKFYIRDCRRWVDIPTEPLDMKDW